jgi:lactoylglutathione lyase
VDIDYIAIFVADVDRAVAFYRDVLGFNFPKPQKHNGCEGSSGALRIGLYHRSWLPQLLDDAYLEQPASQTHPFLLSITVADLDAAYRKLAQAQVDIVQPPRVMPWGQRLFFFKDPDGNLLELVEQAAVEATSQTSTT